MAMTTTEYLGAGQDSLIPYTNTGSAIAAGDLVIRASGTSGCIGRAQGDIAATTGTGTLLIRGLINGVKASGEAFTDGQVLYYDGTSFTGTSSTTFTRAGRAVGISASAATTCVLQLNG